jgi:hypothetical protein
MTQLFSALADNHVPMRKKPAVALSIVMHAAAGDREADENGFVQAVALNRFQERLPNLIEVN